MGVEPNYLWEVQWHGSKGGRVRRFYVTRRTLRWLAVAAAGIAFFLLALLAALPLGLRGYWQRFTVKAVRHENKRLQAEREKLFDQAQELSQEVALRLNRGLRLAWLLRLSPSALPPAPLPENRDALVAWLVSESGKLVVLGQELAGGGQPPCPLEALPTAWPLDSPQAVPVGRFGVRVSPFTGQEEPHFGLTLAAPLGTRVLAAGDGRVVYVGAPRERRTNLWSRLGTLVLLDHGGGVLSLYGHLGQALVRSGQLVKRGQQLAQVGQSGWTRVASLYFEVRWPLGASPVPVDPLLFQLAFSLPELAERLADPAGGLASHAPPLDILLAGRKPPG